jgi:hypothetical protein
MKLATRISSQRNCGKIRVLKSEKLIFKIFLSSSVFKKRLISRSFLKSLCIISNDLSLYSQAGGGSTFCRFDAVFLLLFTPVLRITTPTPALITVPKNFYCDEISPLLGLHLSLNRIWVEEST